MNNLFQRGEYVLASGLSSSFKIDCDFLTDDDIETIAYMINCKLWEDFGSVHGVPRGGMRLAEAMKKYCRPNRTNRTLVVDDVWTTGKSMNSFIDKCDFDGGVIGAVIFSRAPIDLTWVLPLFTLWS